MPPMRRPIIPLVVLSIVLVTSCGDVFSQPDWDDFVAWCEEVDAESLGITAPTAERCTLWADRASTAVNENDMKEDCIVRLYKDQVLLEDDYRVLMWLTTPCVADQDQELWEQLLVEWGADTLSLCEIGAGEYWCSLLRSADNP